MMKKYYILSKNTTVESYQSIFNSFELKDIEIVSYDRAVNHVFVDNIVSSKDSLILFIPTILDPFNAYSYDGVEYALKYYCHFVSIKKEDFQIILLGIEDESAFWKHCEYSSFLRCPHVSYLKNNVYPIKEYLTHIESVVFDMDWTYCIERLKHVNVKKPASYKTHHSITNEWSIYRWSKYLGIENIAIQRDIEEFLYFNYLKAIYPESKINDPKSFYIAEKGKVLLIDDEVGKGWDTFFKSLFENSPDITFDSIGENFKTLSQKEIVDQTTTKLETFDPDLVLLDLRLHDEDFDTTKKASELTGTIIFDVIKEKINKGIQIVVFSASNKVWNYLPFASDGVVLKESPENSMKLNYTQECISNLRKTIENCLKRKILKVFYSKIERVENLILNSNCFEDKTEEIVGGLEIAFDLLTRGVDENEYFSYSYLQLFLVIEEYAKLSSVFDIADNDVYLCNKEKRYRILKDKKQIGNGKMYSYDSVLSYDSPKKHFVFNRDSYDTRFIETNFRISALLIFKYNFNESSEKGWDIICENRNTKAAHPKQEKITTEDIHQILDFMIFFFDENNVNWRPISDAFHERSIEDGITLLQEKYCNL